MKIVTIFSTKGGVGKSTISANFSSVSLLEGRDVITLDFDPNNSLRYHFGFAQTSVDGHALATLSQTSLKNQIKVSPDRSKILPFGNLDDDQLNAYEELLLQDPLMLRKEIESMNLGANDMVIIDAPAGSTIYSQQALNASDVVVIPLLADASSYLTLPQSITMLKRHCLNRPNFDGFMVILNQVNRSFELNTNITEIIKTKFVNHVFAEIHQDQAIPEALACGTNVLSYAPESLGAQDMIDAAQILETYFLGK